MSREEKLQKIAAFGSVAAIDALPAGEGWQTLTPDAHGDWLGQRDDSFSKFIAIGDKKSAGLRLFEDYSSGVKTNRDAWVFNSSRSKVERNMQRMIDFYNAELQRFKSAYQNADKKERKEAVNDFIDNDARCISWSGDLVAELSVMKQGVFNVSAIVPSVYRPFMRQWLYFDGMFNNSVYQMPRIFPHANAENMAIMIKQRANTTEGCFALMVNAIPELHTDGGTQCFPLYLYDSTSVAGETRRQADDTPALDLDGTAAAHTPAYTRRDAITDAGLQHFRTAYAGQTCGNATADTISKEDIFYYVYGLLHSPDYRARYADNLSKELPRIPCVKTLAHFLAFSKAGRELAGWHLNYETCEPYPLQIEISEAATPEQTYRVEKMKHPRTGKEKDKTTVIYNPHITIRGIPPEAWEYIVNGKPALDWVMERQSVKTDKASTIINDANDWATETMHNPRYPLDLFARVTQVSIQTTRIIKTLPPLDI